jgi:hypothetical protein
MDYNRRANHGVRQFIQPFFWFNECFHKSNRQGTKNAKSMKQQLNLFKYKSLGVLGVMAVKFAELKNVSYLYI